MNGEYIKKMDPEAFYERALPYLKEVLKKDFDLKKIAGMVQTRIEVFPDIPELVDFFEAVPEYDSAMYRHKKDENNRGDFSCSSQGSASGTGKHRRIIPMIRCMHL